MSRLPVAGESFGRYVLERKLGQGGMGVVHVARDTVLNRKVALKLVAPHLAEDEEFRVRFAREAETQARLDSPHVVRINDYGEHDGILYLSTQLVEGGDLASRVSTAGALPPALAVVVTAQVLDGLEEAHQAGVVHRDVKPANVLVAERDSGVRAYLCDFGIATTAGQGLTRTGQVIGSLPWMAPERHYGRDSGAAGDLYSAGCLFWYALTGAAPYAGSDGEVMRGHLDGLVPQLVAKTPFARKANAVLLKALAKEPESRYASAAAMARDIRELAVLAPGQVQAADAAPTTVRSAVTRAVTEPRRRTLAGRPWALPLLVAASLLAAVAGGLGVRAFVTDDPALAAGATLVEVGGRTVTMQPTRTISPLPHRTAKGGAGGAVGGGADDIGAVGGDDGAAATRGTPGGPAGGTTGGGGARTAAPAATYRCWNGTLSTGSCAYPTGLAGAEWMVPRAKNLACSDSPPAVGSTNGVHNSYRCGYSGGTGPNAIYLMRMSSETQARNWVNSVISDVGGRNTWSDDREVAGWSVSGTGRHGGTTQYRWGRYWTSAENTWLIFINASTQAARNDGIDLTGGAASLRPLRHVKGVPCSEAGC